MLLIALMHTMELTHERIKGSSDPALQAAQETKIDDLTTAGIVIDQDSIETVLFAGPAPERTEITAAATLCVPPKAAPPVDRWFNQLGHRMGDRTVRLGAGAMVVDIDILLDL